MNQGAQIRRTGEQAFHRHPRQFIGQSRLACLESLVQLRAVVGQPNPDAAFAGLARGTPASTTRPGAAARRYFAQLAPAASSAGPHFRHQVARRQRPGRRGQPGFEHLQIACSSCTSF